MVANPNNFPESIHDDCEVCHNRCGINCMRYSKSSHIFADLLKAPNTKKFIAEEINYLKKETVGNIDIYLEYLTNFVKFSRIKLISLVKNLLEKHNIREEDFLEFADFRAEELEFFDDSPLKDTIIKAKKKMLENGDYSFLITKDNTYKLIDRSSIEDKKTAKMKLDEILEKIELINHYFEIELRNFIEI